VKASFLSCEVQRKSFQINYKSFVVRILIDNIKKQGRGKKRKEEVKKDDRVVKAVEACKLTKLKWVHLNLYFIFQLIFFFCRDRHESLQLFSIDRKIGS
jgi:hypothetical protein